MYSRSFDNIREPEGFTHEENAYTQRESAEESFGVEKHRRGGGIGRLFSGIKTEDLLLIAIALLLLMDGDPDNDILIIALAFLLFF